MTKEFQAELIRHYQTGLGKYPPHTSGLDKYFQWHKKALEMWIAYETCIDLTNAKQAFVKSNGREIFFPLESKYNNVSFDDGHIYPIAKSDKQGVFLKAKKHPDIWVHFNYSDVVLIDFDFDFSHYQ